jgi:predicted transcriptional regulator
LESGAVDIKELSESAEVPRATAQRAAKKLEKEGILSKVGDGKKGNPFRYFRAENVSAQPQT